VFASGFTLNFALVRTDYEHAEMGSCEVRSLLNRSDIHSYVYECVEGVIMADLQDSTKPTVSGNQVDNLIEEVIELWNEYLDYKQEQYIENFRIQDRVREDYFDKVSLNSGGFIPNPPVVTSVPESFPDFMNWLKRHRVTDLASTNSKPPQTDTKSAKEAS
jgi:hypothetical protein